MSKTRPKPAKKPKKRGPKEVRLIVTDDPEVALQRLLNPDKTKPR